MSVPVSVSDAADEAVMDADAVVILPPPMSSGNNACEKIFIVRLLLCLIVMFYVCGALIDTIVESSSEKLIDVDVKS